MFRIFNRFKPYIDLDSTAFENGIKADQHAVIIDVRTPGEFASGRIPGAINIDITRGDFESLVEALDKDKTYFIYCRGGNRSIAACTIFGSNGLRSYNLTSGIHCWSGAIEGTV